MLKERNNIEKCQFIYYEWFGTLENNFHKMINNFEKELEKDYNLKMHQIVQLIKLTYKERL